MTDRSKTILAVLFFIGALTLPLIGLVVGWYKWDAQTGLILLVVTLVILFAIGGLILTTVRDLSWFKVSLPYIFGSLYGVLPDFLPFAVDDAAVTTAGAIFSFTLALRKESETPKWVFLPLVGAGIYTFFGGVIPGGLDEILIDVLALLIAGIGARRVGRKEIKGEQSEG